MEQYNWKRISVVPTWKDLTEAALSKTQRKTPTVVRKHYKISRIRSFYMRKVKFTGVNLKEKLERILTEFPRLEEVHPFYGDLMNVLYDRDHYKVGLGSLKKGVLILDSLVKDYVRLLKYGDSLYRCKELKRSALGRMSSLMKRQGPSLLYLEQVRQHLSRLPSIDPNTRTLIVTGFPNVGKSSFINQISRAQVEVEPYAFTTKSLYLGHCTYKYLSYQVLDTPGLLDHPLQERNTIEMQAITALAHLKSAVLYFLDPSEECGYSLQAQKALFESLRPLFADKPLLIVGNKSDVWGSLDSLPPEKQAVIQEITEGEDKIPFMEMSAKDDPDSISAVKNTIAEMLLQWRVETKCKTKKVHGIANRIHVAQPQQQALDERPPFIPQAVISRRTLSSNQAMDVVSSHEATNGKKKLLEKDIEAKMGDDYILDLNKRWDLPNSDHLYDKIPEHWNGHNVADFLDPDISKKLKALERDEEAREKAGFYDSEIEEEDEELEKIQELAQKIRNKKKLLKNDRRLNETKKPIMPRTSAPRKRERSVSRLQQEFSNLGVDMSGIGDTNFAQMEKRSTSRPKIKKARMDENGCIRNSQSIPRSQSGVRDKSQALKIKKINKKTQNKKFNKLGKAGESDRKIISKMPKHLFAGKRSVGKTDRR